MKNWKSKILTGIVVILISAVMFGCFGNNSLNGTWLFEDLDYPEGSITMVFSDKNFHWKTLWFEREGTFNLLENAIELIPSDDPTDIWTPSFSRDKNIIMIDNLQFVKQ